MGIKEQLFDLGFSNTEVDIYLALLQHGSLQAGEVSKKTSINRTTAYQVLERLLDKGLVSFVKKGNIKIFQATSPETLVALQQDKVILAKNLLGPLQSLQSPQEEKVSVYQGRKGIRTIMNQILTCKEYISFGSAGHFLDIMRHDFLLYQKEKRKRKIKSKVILGKSSRKKPIVKEAHAQFRFIDDKFMAPTTTWVFKGKVAIVVWSEKPIATVIESEKLAKAYSSYFEILWMSAKR